MNQTGKKWTPNFNIEAKSITLLLFLSILFIGIESSLHLGRFFVIFKTISIGFCLGLLTLHLNPKAELKPIRHILIFLYFAIQIAFYSYVFLVYNHVISFKLIALTFSLLGYLFFKSRAYLVTFFLFNIFHLLALQILLDKYTWTSAVYLTVCLTANYLLYRYIHNQLLGISKDYTKSFDSKFTSPNPKTYHA
jgi:hypothetical protein